MDHLRAVGGWIPSCGKGDGKVFLPFEDERHSLILSKALLLVAEPGITGKTILTQVKRGDVTVRDETGMGKPLTEWEAAGLPERMTVRELIRLRVREEAARHKARPSDRFNGLVRPDDAEVDLNGCRIREPRPIDWERQAEIVERAALTDGIFVPADDRQFEELDDVVDLAADPDLLVNKLVALVGG
nr:hypothetical protein OG999_46780 [Streptomyces sp. NBC_00886]